MLEEFVNIETGCPGTVRTRAGVDPVELLYDDPDDIWGFGQLQHMAAELP